MVPLNKPFEAYSSRNFPGLGLVSGSNSGSHLGLGLVCTLGSVEDEDNK